MRDTEILSLQNVCKHFPITGGVFKRETARLNVLNGVDLSIREGEIFGLVGESGCGKSTLARLLMKLLEASSGEILFSERPLSTIAGREKKQFYQQVQMVFQDPYSSLNPRMRVRNILGEMVRIRGASRDEEASEVRAILSDVGLREDALDKYPHEFSGGQRQRIAIARALIVRPRLLIADEPVSALDLTIQAQILALLKALKEKYSLTILFVSHDLNIVAAFCNRVAVMYLGRIVEVIEARRLFLEGLHPYLRALLESLPVPDPTLRRRRGKLIKGEVPSPIDLPTGCAFHPRCPLSIPLCEKERPPLTKRPHNTPSGRDHRDKRDGQGESDGHYVACHCA